VNSSQPFSWEEKGLFNVKLRIIYVDRKTNKQFILITILSLCKREIQREFER
jgi:hypothetical protein